MRGDDGLHVHLWHEQHGRDRELIVDVGSAIGGQDYVSLPRNVDVPSNNEAKPAGMFS